MFYFCKNASYIHLIYINFSSINKTLKFIMFRPWYVHSTNIKLLFIIPNLRLLKIDYDKWLRSLLELKCFLNQTSVLQRLLRLFLWQYIHPFSMIYLLPTSCPIFCEFVRPMTLINLLMSNIRNKLIQQMGFLIKVFYQSHFQNKWQIFGIPISRTISRSNFLYIFRCWWCTGGILTIFKYDK